MKAPAKFKVGDRVVYIGKDKKSKIGSVGTITAVQVYELQFGIFINKIDWDILKDMRNSRGKVDEALEHESIFNSPLYKALT